MNDRPRNILYKNMKIYSAATLFITLLTAVNAVSKEDNVCRIIIVTII